MKKKNKIKYCGNLLAQTIILVLLLPTVVFADNCNISILLNESIDASSKINFSYLGVESEYKASPILKTQNTDGYSIEISSTNKSLGLYSFSTALLKYFDTNEGGGIIVEESGTNKITIPYFVNAAYFVVYTNGSEKLRQDFSLVNVQCERKCLLSGEKGVFKTDYCCNGLTPVQEEEINFICVSCGDGVCSNYEDEYNCSKDCKKENDILNCAFGTVPNLNFPWNRCVEPNVCGNGILEPENNEVCDEYGNNCDLSGCFYRYSRNKIVEKVQARSLTYLTSFSLANAVRDMQKERELLTKANPNYFIDVNLTNFEVTKVDLYEYSPYSRLYTATIEYTCDLMIKNP